MKMKYSTLLMIISLIATIACTALGVEKDNDSFKGTIPLKGISKSKYSSLAKISLQDAIGIAIKTTSGKVTEAALEKEDGYLVYEIEVTMSDKTRKELIIDAGNGKVLEIEEKNKKNEKENDNEDDE